MHIRCDAHVRIRLPISRKSRPLPDLPARNQRVHKLQRHSRNDHRELWGYFVCAFRDSFTNNLIQHRGGIFAGGLSQYIGRRLTIMWASLNAKAFQTSPNFLFLFFQYFCSPRWGVHSALGHSTYIQQALRRGFLCSIRCPRVGRISSRGAL